MRSPKEAWSGVIEQSDKLWRSVTRLPGRDVTFYRRLSASDLDNIARRYGLGAALDYVMEMEKKAGEDGNPKRDH